MTDASPRGSPWFTLAVAALVTTGVAGLAVPPSYIRPGLSRLERGMAYGGDVALLTAVLAALIGLFLSVGGRRGATRWWVGASLLLLNVAGFLAGRFGVDTIGLTGTAILSAPCLLLLALHATTSQPPGRA